MKRWLFAWTLVSCATLAGCGTPGNTIADGADATLILRGNDAVAYFTEGRPFRVPHYKTDAELDAEYERREADGNLPPELR